jgi:hypothetical protein
MSASAFLRSRDNQTTTPALRQGTRVQLRDVMSMHASTAVLERGQSLQLLREDQVSLRVPSPSYESEGSERVSRGSVTVPSGGRWSASLEVRMRDDQGALLTINRSGPGTGPAPSDASLMIPPGEADALLILLAGLVKQARADGVLAPRAEGKPRRSTGALGGPPSAPSSSG